MFVKSIVITCALTLHITGGALLLWSNKKIEVPPLESFEEDSFNALVAVLGYPEVSLYKTTPSLLPAFEELLKGYYTAYNPNGDISAENATEISERIDFELIAAQQHLGSSRGASILSALIIPGARIKRETTQTNETVEGFKTAKGPVLYKGKFKETYCLLYSSQPLFLKTAHSNVSLGATSDDMVTVDASNIANIKLNIKIPIENNIVSLRFSFTSQGGYWSLTSVKTSDNQGLYSFNLTIEGTVQAPARFSYHCNGATTFADSNKTTELFIYDMQLQTDAKQAKFNDAYDCVDFTTAPIWSGLFISALLGLVLMFGLVAITNIKSMDKFDNAKTKQLSITVVD